MLTCTFFGHKDTPKKIEPILRPTLIDLIKNKNVCNFYIGNHGNFDHMVKRSLIELNEIYPINYAVVPAYLPGKKYNPEEESPTDTILPDGIETVPRKFTINYRNKWMIEQSDSMLSPMSSIPSVAPASLKNLLKRKRESS